MNEPTIFSFEEQEIRTVVEGGAVYWVAKDVAIALGYTNPSKAISDHCKGVTKRYPLQTTGGVQEFRIIGEPDLYRLIASSKLPEAERFERWMFEEILPTIRRTGGYPTVPHKICSLCAGKHRPEELEIIDMVIGNCEACGEEKTLSSNRGKEICSSCTALYGAANNRPELVLQILRELKPELLDERLPEQDNVSELEQQLYRSREYAHEMEGKLMAAEDRIDELLANLIRAIKEEWGNDEDKADALREELEDERRQLCEVTGGKHSIHDSALLDLALDVLKGEITGLKAERIEALRGM